MDRRHCNTAAILDSHRKLVGLGAAAASVALHFAVRAAGSVDALFTWVPLACPLRMFTGIECPTCGLGHAIVEAFTGEWAASWGHHPAGIVVVLMLGVGSLVPNFVAGAAAGLRALAQHRRVTFAAFLAYAIWGFARG